MANVLLLGEDRDRASGLRALLRQDGHRVRWVRDVEGWRQAELESAAEVVVAAVASSASVLASPERPARGFPAPLLFVHHDADPFSEPMLDERIVDRIESPFMAEEFLGRVDALVRVRRIVRREQPRHGKASPATGARALAGWMSAILGTRVPRFTKPRAPYLEVAARVADWTDRRDGFEPGHAERVASFSAMIAEELHLTDAELTPVLRAAMLHDIGKATLPAQILRQTGPLEERQVRLLRTHADRGARLLRALDRDEEVAAAVQYHHEHVDGSGYCGRKGEEIPLAARIVAVAEAYDAMTTSRTREPLRRDEALAVLDRRRGSQFDAACVDALVSTVKPRPRSLPVSPRF
jgi:putative nucleotidyltransferase with HDIG domain